jgi:hypothetical protein
MCEVPPSLWPSSLTEDPNINYHDADDDGMDVEDDGVRH